MWPQYCCSFVQGSSLCGKRGCYPSFSFSLYHPKGLWEVLSKRKEMQSQMDDMKGCLTFTLSPRNECILAHYSSIFILSSYSHGEFKSKLIHYVSIIVTCLVLLLWIKINSLFVWRDRQAGRLGLVRLLNNSTSSLWRSAQKKHLVFQLAVFLSRNVWCGLPLITQHAL